MRRVLAVVAMALVLAACSKATEGPDQPAGTAEEKARSGSDVAPAVAPGVALTYAYRYRLPVEQVVRVQETHAATCEALGPARCRITGMHYWAGERRTIGASLALRLAPAIARAYGRNATAAAIGAGGMLAEASIESVDAGRTAQAAGENVESLAAESRQVEAQLAGGKGGAAERAALQARAAGLREAARGARAEVTAAEATLATTPLTIAYESGAVEAGIGDGPLLGAVRDGWANILYGLAIILLIAVTIVPWVLALALLIGIWSRVRRPVRRLLGLEDVA